MIGARLKLARTAAGLSLRALAALLDGRVSAQAIGKYERDEMMPTSPVLLALSKALNIAPDYLLSNRDLGLHGIEFRKGSGAGLREEKTVQARVIEKLERYLAVEEALGLQSAHWHAPLPELEPVRDSDAAEAAANELRRSWRLGIDPIGSMTETLEEHGVKVIALDLPPEVSGSKALARASDNNPVAAVVINQNHKGERQRSTLAHELAHLVLRHDVSMKRVDVERAMDRFGGSFLVHKDELCRLAGSHRQDVSLGELVELKQHFKVSLQCLVVRLKQALILSESGARELWASLKALGFFSDPWPEPGPIPSEKSHRMHRLALRAVSEGALSESRAAELLGISARQLNRWLAEGKHTVAA